MRGAAASEACQQQGDSTVSHLSFPVEGRTRRSRIKIQNSESFFPFSFPWILPAPNFCLGWDFTDKEASIPQKVRACRKGPALASDPTCSPSPVPFHTSMPWAFASRVSFCLHSCHSCLLFTPLLGPLLTDSLILQTTRDLRGQPCTSQGV